VSAPSAPATLAATECSSAAGRVVLSVGSLDLRAAIPTGTVRLCGSLRQDRAVESARFLLESTAS